MKPFTPDLKADLTAIGGIYTLILILSMWIYSDYKLKHELYQLKSDYYQAKTVIVELDNTNTSLHQSLISMNEAYDDIESKFYNDIPGMCRLIGVYVNLRDNIKP